MIDTRTARWITENYALHSRNWGNGLTPFGTRYTSLRYDDFRNYLNWAGWCRETAYMLTHSTNAEWTARDVEMAVFAAAREDLPLNPLS
jgi:hypothetical protein